MDELLEGVDIWSSREVLNGSWGSSGARGARRGAEGMLLLRAEASDSGIIDGILVRR